MTLVSLSLVLKDRTLNLNKKRERKRLFSCILMKRAINQCSINSEKMSVLGLMIPQSWRRRVATFLNQC